MRVNDRYFMHACPSCAAPLDDEGICTSCGALTRGFFRGLELGTPRIAEAVARGFDFYRLLGVASELDTRALARRYRKLRVLFPDDPSGLAPEPLRRLELLELAGRVLTDPRLRQTYDELRAGHAEIAAGVLRCAGCAAPFAQEATHCPYCGVPRPSVPTAPAAPPTDPGPPPTEPVDYYAMLGLTPRHLFPPSVSGPSFHPLGHMSLLDVFTEGDEAWTKGSGQLAPPAPPKPDDIDAAALAQERAILLMTGLAAKERHDRLEEIEIARRILRHDRHRGKYDSLLLGFSQGLLDGGRLDALRDLQQMVRADMAEERGEQVSVEEGAALLRQGRGYLEARLPGEALVPLRRALSALPLSADVHLSYVQAILTSEDPLALGGHRLRELQRSLAALWELGTQTSDVQALMAFCRGLLARDVGQTAEAEAELQAALRLNAALGPAWRGLAALALGRDAFGEALDYCRRALAIDRCDERALLMMAAACLRSGRRDQAYEAAAQIATVRGAEWTADAVLRELQ